MNRAQKQSKSLPLPPENEVISKDLPGYPFYPAIEDMFQKSREESDIDPDDITKAKAPNEKSFADEQTDYDEDNR
jgi:predicted solute-binding protein